jgi:hypothetical protein
MSRAEPSRHARSRALMPCVVLAFAALAGCGKDAATGSSGTARSPAPPGTVGFSLSKLLVVDQFGYRPLDPKTAVIRSPMVGYDAGADADAGPAAGGRYEVRRSTDGGIVFAGAPSLWNNGATQASSGDRGWWFDFSSVNTPGDYFIADPARHLRSPTFAIDGHVYRKVLKAAMRTYFYQRSGFAKQEPYADRCWTDAAAYLGAHQDTQARDVADPDNPAKIRDLSGGWFDAGDMNKYVTFAVPAVHQLLSAYSNNPDAFTDDFGIPESGNGIPDILDELKWETDWLEKMQNPDGSAALKVGDLANVKASPPSSDVSPRYYVSSCTSATIAAAGMFAHAAVVYRGLPALAGTARELATRAAAAWRDFNRKAHELHCDTGLVRSGNADWDAGTQDGAAVVAAIYLYAATGDAQYEEYVKAHYRETYPYRDFGWSRYHAEQGEALLFYTALAGADGELKARIRADKQADVAAPNGVYGFNPDSDLYRAFLNDAQYHWGSNQVRANYGNTNLDAAAYGMGPAPAGATDAGPTDAGATNAGPYRLRALEILHYFHGVNPLAMVYLTNMYALGASNSANEIFHLWFGRYSSDSSA